MTRIWHQSVNELDHLTTYRDALVAQAVAILPADVTVEVRGLASGTYGGASPPGGGGEAGGGHPAAAPRIQPPPPAPAGRRGAPPLRPPS